MVKHSTAAAGIGYQVDLFKPNRIIKKLTKPVPERPLRLEELNLLLGDVLATARKYRIAERPVYHVVFSDGRKPLVITSATRPYGKDFWTSIPEGRQKEAEQTGRLIENTSKG